MFEKNNKENIYSNIGLQKITSMNRSRTNIGEQIRKKLKIKPLSSDVTNVLMPRNQNTFQEPMTKLESKNSF